MYTPSHPLLEKCMVINTSQGYTSWGPHWGKSAVCIHFETIRHLHCEQLCYKSPAALIKCCKEKDCSPLWHNTSHQIPPVLWWVCVCVWMCMSLNRCSVFMCWLSGKSADCISPFDRMAFWKPGLQNEWHGSRDLSVSICLHAGRHRCWQVQKCFFLLPLEHKTVQFPFPGDFHIWIRRHKKAQSYKFMRKYFKKKITVINVLLRALIHIGSFTANWH